MIYCGCNLSSNPFRTGVVSTAVNTKLSLIIIDLKSFTPDLEAYIDEKLVRISRGGNRNRKLATEKKSLKNYLKKKTVETSLGSVAEFFIHLYLSTTNYNQICLFRNLEEDSIKKGNSCTS